MDREGSKQSPQTGFEAFHGHIASAAKNLEKLKSKGMGDYGLSGTHTLCMRQLSESSQGLTRTELAYRCNVDRAQITRVIGELLAKEYVKEIGNGSNYRKKCVLTEEGRKISQDINDRVKRIQQFVSGEIPKESLEIFYKTLEEICDNLEKAESMLTVREE